MEEEQIKMEDFKEEENIQLAENENVDSYDDIDSYASKRELLEKTKILSLICFLYKAPDSYLNFTCDQLVKMFELPAEVIRTYVLTSLLWYP